MQLSPGDEIVLFEMHKGNKGWKKLGNYKVLEIKPQYILADAGHYKETINIFDLRSRRFRIFRPGGKEIVFSQMPNMKQIIDGQRLGDITNEVNCKEEDEVDMAVMTKEIVKSMIQQGKSIDEIVKHFAPSYPKMNESILRAKISYYTQVETEKAQKKQDKKQRKEQKQKAKDPEPTPDPVKQTDITPAIETIKAATPAAAHVKSTLKPKSLISQVSNMEYELMDEYVEIAGTGTDGIDTGLLSISWANISTVIAELQEIQRMVNE